MNSQILIFFLSILLFSCSSKSENEQKNIKTTSKVNDTLSYYQIAKAKVVKLFEDDEQEEKIIKKKQNLSDKYEEYNAVKKWFKTSNLEILEKDNLNYYKIVKAETAYKNETSISYFTTPDKGIKYCYFTDDYIYFIEFNYKGTSVNFSNIERLSRGFRFEDFESLTFNDDGKIIQSIEKEYDYRYNITKNEDGFCEITYKNKLWEIIGKEKIATTLTIDSPEFDTSWQESKVFDYTQDYFWFKWLLFV